LSQELKDLHDRMGHELEELERTVQLAHSAWEGARHFPEHQEHFSNSLALNLHSFCELPPTRSRGLLASSRQP
jgi:hypothetical protein